MFFFSPFRSRVSSLPPPARANHVLLSRSPLSGARPLRYRAQLVLRVRHESSFSSTTLSPFPPHAGRGASALARATRRSLVLRVVRSPARAARRSLVLRVRYVKHALPPPARLPSSALSTISLGRDRSHYAGRCFCPRRSCAPCASRLLLSTLTPFLRLLLMHRLLFLSYTRARGSPSISSCFFELPSLFCVRHPTVTLVCRLSQRSLSH